MRKELTNELEVAAPADALWEIYGSLQLPKLIVQLLPVVIQNIDVVEGDGGLGTVLDVHFVPGSVPLSYKEKFVTIDKEKRLKEVVQVEGGYLDLGCTFYMTSFQILEKGCDSCIIKSMVTYEVDDELESKVSPLVTIDAHAAVAQVISMYVVEKQGAA